MNCGIAFDFADAGHWYWWKETAVFVRGSIGHTSVLARMLASIDEASKTVKVLGFMMLPDTRNSVTLLERAQDSPIPNAWEFLEGEVCSSGGMVLTGENWFTGRKTLYSVGGRWMNGYGAMVEWYWQGKTDLLGEKHYTVWVVDEWMVMEQWWNDTDRGKLKYWEKNIC